MREALSAVKGSGMLNTLAKVKTGRLLILRLTHARKATDWTAYKEFLKECGLTTPFANQCIRLTTIFLVGPNILRHSRLSRVLNCFKSFVALIAKNKQDWPILGTDFNGASFSLGGGSHAKSIPRIKSAPMTMLLGGRE